MKDFEVFAQYWNEAVNGLVYGIQKCEDAFLSKSRVQAIWTEELLTRRFRSEGVLHGSRQFLDELAQREPEKARQIIARAEERARQLYQVTNEYSEDALARTEEAVQAALDEVKQQRLRFRTASSAKAQEQREKMGEKPASEAFSEEE